MKSKKYLIVLILRILETHSDKNHPLTQTEIAKLISCKFPCDRKTVGRNIQFLREVNYPIVKTTKGFYMDNQQFSRGEIEYIIDSVSKNPSPLENKDELCEKLYSSLSRYYKRGDTK